MKRSIRTYAQAAEPAGAALADQITAQHERVRARLASVRNLIGVASGKGGVGKSFVAAHLAATLAERGQRVGALDADLNGPCLAAMLGAARTPLRVDGAGVHPARGRAGCKVMSSDLLLADATTPLRWQGPAEGAFVWQSTLEAGMLREFVSDVVWGDIDALVIDLPPGTDKIGRTLSLLPPLAALIIVTTPSRAAQGVVARALTYVREARVARVGVVRNMDGITCQQCGTVTPLFADASATQHEETLWASLPFDPAAAEATDRGDPLPRPSALHSAFAAFADRVCTELANGETP